MLISCLCVTQNRSGYLKKSIDCFFAQTITDSELVIVTDSSDGATIELVTSYKDSRLSICLIENMDGLSLGELRNVAIRQAAGDCICTWDDDDWYNVDRLEIMFNAFNRYKKPCIVQSRVLLYDEVNNLSYLSYRRMWENTLLVDRQFLLKRDIQYPHLDKNEDYEFLNRLIELNAVASIDDASLYIYRFSGSNTCGRSHFDVIFGYSISLSEYHNAVLRRAFDEDQDVRAVSKSLYSQYFLENLPYIPNVPDRI